jgi:hypothetical protein
VARQGVRFGADGVFSLKEAGFRAKIGAMATVVEFACPRCSAGCTCHARPGEMVRCPHCYSFITVPVDESPQFKITEDESAPETPTIVFRCPYCQSRIETDPANAGLACLCPGCHAGLTIPGNASPIFLHPSANRSADEFGPRVERISASVMLVVAALAVALIALVANWLRS